MPKSPFRSFGVAARAGAASSMGRAPLGATGASSSWSFARSASGVSRVASLRETLEEARRELGLEVVACDTAVRLVGLDPAALAGVVDRIVTLPQLWAEARDGRQLLV